jgi:hypothetical protein
MATCEPTWMSMLLEAGARAFRRKFPKKFR